MSRPSRRTGSPVTLSLWLRLLKAHNLILREVRRTMTAHGTTLPRFDVLAQLERATEGLTPRDLARRLLVTAGNLTVIVKQLEKEGLVVRRAVERDRRSYLLVLTPTGRRRISRLIPRHEEDLQRVLGAVPRKTQERLRELLGETLESLNAPDEEPARAPGEDHAQPTA